MSSVISALAELAEVGLTQEKIDKAIAESAEVCRAVIEKTEEVKATWLAIWDAQDHPYETGTYRDSIHIRYKTKWSGSEFR
jgi:hypothetical protein